jgi:hypothetical protein
MVSELACQPCNYTVTPGDKFAILQKASRVGTPHTGSLCIVVRSALFFVA